MTMEQHNKSADRIEVEGRLVQKLTTQAVRSFLEGAKLDASDPQNVADSYARFAIECLAALVLNGAPEDTVRSMVNVSIDKLAEARMLALSATSAGGSA